MRLFLCNNVMHFEEPRGALVRAFNLEISFLTEIDYKCYIYIYCCLCRLIGHKVMRYLEIFFHHVYEFNLFS